MSLRAWPLVLALGLVGLLPATLRAASGRAASPQGGPPDAADIHDIHGPVAGRAPRRVWPYLACAGVAAGVVAAFSLRARRHAPPPTPAERALRDLAAMRSGTSVDSRGFSFSVSEIVRRYVEDRFALRAAHRTTEELLGDLMRDASPVARHRAELGELLHRCDLAKFAGWSLSPVEISSMLASAETFVRATSAAAPEATAAPRRMTASRRNDAGRGLPS
jgi:hypothetical protein